VFHADRWVGAFLAVAGDNAESAFLCLRAFAPPVKSIRGVFFGHNASAELEKMLRESVNACGITKDPPAVEYAVRFICLLVEKDCFRYIDSLLARMEQKLDEQRNILALSLEAAAPVDRGFEEKLTRIIKEKTGASGVKMKTSVRPELLGGYRLRVGGYAAGGGFYIDASLKGQIERMKADLEAVI